MRAVFGNTLKHDDEAKDMEPSATPHLQSCRSNFEAAPSYGLSCNSRFLCSSVRAEVSVWFGVRRYLNEIRRFFLGETFVAS